MSKQAQLLHRENLQQLNINNYFHNIDAHTNPSLLWVGFIIHNLPEFFLQTSKFCILLQTCLQNNHSSCKECLMWYRKNNSRSDGVYWIRWAELIASSLTLTLSSTVPDLAKSDHIRQQSYSTIHWWHSLSTSPSTDIFTTIKYFKKKKVFRKNQKSPLNS